MFSLFLASTGSRSSLNFGRFGFLQNRGSRRWAPGIIIPKDKLHYGIRAQDVLYTVAFEKSRTWQIIKPWRRRILHDNACTNLKEIKELIQTPRWSEYPEDEIKTAVTNLVSSVKPPADGIVKPPFLLKLTVGPLKHRIKIKDPWSPDSVYSAKPVEKGKQEKKKKEKKQKEDSG
eukprot:TRINITY_DN2934_c0_g1_i3.p1 TRINITY_DN2934_c0_g1~~TRINITY_DN2934_c0_g1_i3.p1  ORF type:complete len:175 (+),score=31.12 TRINITY_DN2934_c0_g1_i3:79-603(+)